MSDLPSYTVSHAKFVVVIFHVFSILNVNFNTFSREISECQRASVPSSVNLMNIVKLHVAYLNYFSLMTIFSFHNSFALQPVLEVWYINCKEESHEKLLLKDGCET
jgi:hypothetical protein